MFTQIQKIIENNQVQLFTKQTVQKRLKLNTREARAVYQKTVTKLQTYLYFEGSVSVIQHLPKEITRKLSEYKINNNILNDFKINESWKLPYDLLLITENEDTYKKGKKKGWPIELIHEHMLQDLDSYDIIRAFDTPNCENVLDTLDSCIFVSNEADLYPEEQLATISKWEPIIPLLKESPFPEIQEAVANLKLVTPLLSPTASFSYDYDDLSLQLPSIQQLFAEKLKTSTFTGSDFISMMSNKTFPEELNHILKNICEEKQFPYEVIQKTFPLSLDEDVITQQNQESKQNEWHSFTKELEKHSCTLNKTNEYLKILKTGLFLTDIIGAITQFSAEYETTHAKEGEYLIIEKSKNIFLEDPQAISYHLEESHKGAVLTGANSGGKTTLLEHIIQLVTLAEFGWPVSGNVTIPNYDSIYYFAKNKGSASKGAFETMLTQLSKIKPENALILADEMEAVTEPSIASQIIAATLNHFTQHGAQAVFATHLGKDILPHVKESIRIDGIKAIGIQNGTILIDHNPKIGELANSTPELIIEKMAKNNNSFLNHLLKEIKQ